MAKFEAKLPDELLLKLSQLGRDFESVAEKVLVSGGEVALSTVRKRLSSVVGKDTKYPSRATGELERSLGLSPVKLNKDGNHDIKVGFSEPRADGSSNAMLANVLEYGKHGQPAKPFLKPVKATVKRECVRVMQERFDEEVKKL